MLNDKLIAYRKMLKINQETMAKIIGISLTSYNHKETCKNDFTQSEMINITNVIKKQIPEITMDEIFFNHKLGKLLRNNSA